MDISTVEAIRRRVEVVPSSLPERLDSVSQIDYYSRRFRQLTREEKSFLCEVVRKCSNSPEPEEREAARQAMELLIACHLRLVMSWAKKYACPQVPLEDLVQAGCMGLMTAVERYSPERGTELTTYASWWIRRRIQLLLSQHLSQPNNSPTLPAIISLDEEYDSEKEPVDSDIGIGLAVEELREMIAGLPSREAVALCLRYGIGCQGYSYEEIARAMRVSRETARSLVRRAIARLRHPRRRRILGRYGHL